MARAHEFLTSQTGSFHFKVGTWTAAQPYNETLDAVTVDILKAAKRRGHSIGKITYSRVLEWEKEHVLPANTTLHNADLLRTGRTYKILHVPRDVQEDLLAHRSAKARSKTSVPGSASVKPSISASIFSRHAQKSLGETASETRLRISVLGVLLVGIVFVLGMRGRRLWDWFLSRDLMQEIKRLEPNETSKRRDSAGRWSNRILDLILCRDLTREINRLREEKGTKAPGADEHIHDLGPLLWMGLQSIPALVLKLGVVFFGGALLFWGGRRLLLAHQLAQLQKKEDGKLSTPSTARFLTKIIAGSTMILVIGCLARLMNQSISVPQASPAQVGSLAVALPYFHHGFWTDVLWPFAGSFFGFMSFLLGRGILRIRLGSQSVDRDVWSNVVSPKSRWLWQGTFLLFTPLIFAFSQLFVEPWLRAALVASLIPILLSLLRLEEKQSTIEEARIPLQWWEEILDAAEQSEKGLTPAHRLDILARIHPLLIQYRYGARPPEESAAFFEHVRLLTKRTLEAIPTLSVPSLHPSLPISAWSEEGQMVELQRLKFTILLEHAVAYRKALDHYYVPVTVESYRPLDLLRTVYRKLTRFSTWLLGYTKSSRENIVQLLNQLEIVQKTGNLLVPGLYPMEHPSVNAEHIVKRTYDQASLIRRSSQAAPSDDLPAGLRTDTARRLVQIIQGRPQTLFGFQVYWLDRRILSRIVFWLAPTIMSLLYFFQMLVDHFAHHQAWSAVLLVFAQRSLPGLLAGFLITLVVHRFPTLAWRYDYQERERHYAKELKTYWNAIDPHLVANMNRLAELYWALELHAILSAAATDPSAVDLIVVVGPPERKHIILERVRYLERALRARFGLPADFVLPVSYCSNANADKIPDAVIIDDYLLGQWESTILEEHPSLHGKDDEEDKKLWNTRHGIISSSNSYDPLAKLNVDLSGEPPKTSGDALTLLDLAILQVYYHGKALKDQATYGDVYVPMGYVGIQPRVGVLEGDPGRKGKPVEIILPTAWESIETIESEHHGFILTQNDRAETPYPTGDREIYSLYSGFETVASVDKIGTPVRLGRVLLNDREVSQLRAYHGMMAIASEDPAQLEAFYRLADEAAHIIQGLALPDNFKFQLHRDYLIYLNRLETEQDLPTFTGKIVTELIEQTIANDWTVEKFDEYLLPIFHFVLYLSSKRPEFLKLAKFTVATQPMNQTFIRDYSRARPGEIDADSSLWESIVRAARTLQKARSKEIEKQIRVLKLNTPAEKQGMFFKVFPVMEAAFYQTHGKKGLADRMIESFQKDGPLLGALIGDEIVGYLDTWLQEPQDQPPDQILSGVSSDDILYVAYWAVLPYLHGLGIGTHLQIEATRRAQQMGRSHITSHIQDEHAQHFADHMARHDISVELIGEPFLYQGRLIQRKTHINLQQRGRQTLSTKA